MLRPTDMSQIEQKLGFWRALERDLLREISKNSHPNDALKMIAEAIDQAHELQRPVAIYVYNQKTRDLERLSNLSSALPATIPWPAQAAEFEHVQKFQSSVPDHFFHPIVGIDGHFLGLVAVPINDSRDRYQATEIAESTAHISAVGLERASFHIALREREMELARVQAIGKVGGVEVNFIDGFNNRRSPEYLQIHGLPATAAHESHEDWVNRIHPHDRDETVRHFLAAIEGDTVDYTSEYRIVRPNDGEVRWISVKARIERDQNQKAIRLVGAHIDVTDRMIAQSSLRESEERFRLIADSAPVPIWVTKLDRTRSFANRAYVDFLGLSYDESVVFDWRKILHPDDAQRILQEQIAGEASLKPFTLEARFRRADGKYRWLRSQSQPRWDANGSHIGFIGVAYDITAAKEALQKSEVQFEMLVQAVVDYALFMISPTGIVTSWNAGAERIKGYLPGEIIGKHFSIFYNNDDIANGLPNHALATATREGRFENEGLRVRKDGTKFWAHVVLDRIEAEDGSLIGFAKITRDITERKQAEANLQKAQEELFQSQKIEAIGQLTGGVAHDFNNLLMAIQGSIELVQRRLPDDAPVHRFLNNAHEAAQRGARLTQRMLAFARRQDLKPTDLDLVAQIEGLRHLLETTLGPTCQIVTDFPLDLLHIHADANQFDLAILNLLVNSRDAMAKGGAIAIRATNVAAANEQRFVELAISDTGIGMDETTLNRALEPFFTTKGVGKGTGLGLSMVHGMMEQLGGKLSIDSAIGKGTTIKLLFPATYARAASAPETHSEANINLQYPTSVLAVDDDPLVLLNTVTMLEDLGFKVYQANSAKEALDVLQNTKVNLLITDQAMPTMTGIELIEQARKIDPSLPVVIATGYAELPDHTNATFKKLAKPFLQKDLEEAVASVL